MRFLRIGLSGCVFTFIYQLSSAQTKVYIKAEALKRPLVNYSITYNGETVDRDEFIKEYATPPTSRSVTVTYKFGCTNKTFTKTFSNTKCVKERQNFSVRYETCTPFVDDDADLQLYFQIIPAALKTPYKDGTGANSVSDCKPLTMKTEGVASAGVYEWYIGYCYWTGGGGEELLKLLPLGGVYKLPPCTGDDCPPPPPPPPHEVCVERKLEETTNPWVTITAAKLGIWNYGTYFIYVKPKGECSYEQKSLSTTFTFDPNPAPTKSGADTTRTILCENDYFTLHAAVSGPLEWQVREELTGSWQYLTQTSGNTITIGLNDIYKSGTKFLTPRYVRYKCLGSSDDLASNASPPIVYYPSSPSLTSANVEITPASCTGRSDGKVVIKNVTGGTAIIRVALKDNVKGSLVGNNKFDWNKSGVFTYDGVPDGSFTLQIENNDVKNCPTNFPLTVGVKPAIRFTAIKKVDPTCRERSDGSIEVAVADGLTPREYTLYKNDGKGVWVEQKKVRPADLSYTFTTLSQGNYKVMASDGCQIVSQEVMLQNPVFRMDTVSTTPAYCGLAYGKITVQMSGGKSPYTYSWKYGAQTLLTTKATAENLLPGMYTVTGTDANGCSGPPLSVEVVEGIHPTLTVGSVPTGCGLAKGIGMVEIKQGFWPYTYSWKDKAGNTLRAITRKESSDTLAHLLKGTYQVVVQDSKGCQVQTKVEITEHAPLAITILSTTPASCPQSSDGKALIKVEGGLAPYIYEWNDAGKQTKAEAINLKSGNYTIKVTDALGCSKEQTVEVKSIPELTFSETIKPPTCYETCDASIHVAVSGGTPPYKYMWSTGVISNTIQSLCEGSYSLTVEDAKKCVKTVSYTIVKPSELSGVLKEKEATICSGQVMTLDPGEWKSYSWKNQQGNLIGQDRILKITQAGHYFLEVTNPYGCVIKDQFILHTSTNLLEAKIIFANPQVVGDTVVLTEISWPKPETWSWTYPSQLITYEQGPAPSQQQVILSEPGTYWIRFIAGLGECRDTVIRTMTVLPKSESTNLLNQLSAVLGSKAITKLSLYPNPNSGKFTLEITLEKAAPVQIQLYGWQSTDPMYQTTFEENTIHKQELDVLGVSKGLYVLMIYVAGEKPRLIKLMIE